MRHARPRKAARTIQITTIRITIKLDIAATPKKYIYSHIPLKCPKCLSDIPKFCERHSTALFLQYPDPLLSETLPQKYTVGISQVIRKESFSALSYRASTVVSHCSSFAFFSTSIECAAALSIFYSTNN